MMDMDAQEPRSWIPDRPTSKGAAAFHEAVIDASWNHECLDELISLARPNINDDQIVVDFGAGTGTSSIRILQEIRKKIKLWLVDNSPAWLGKAYEFLHDYPNVKFFVLERKDNVYATLSETVGKESIHHVISANTFHLVPNLKETFKGIADALKPKGTFVFNSGNVIREGRPEGALMIDSTVYRVHDIAIDILKTDAKFAKYRKDLDKRIYLEIPQRRFIFPEPRPIQDYLKALNEAGFKYIEPYYKCFKLKYDDWLTFLRVKRLQAGILPEVGGKEPSEEEERDRDTIITIAAKKLFDELKKFNPLADDKTYQGEWIYVSAIKSS